MEESVLTRTFEMLVERLGAVEAQNALLLDALRHADEERTGRVHGALHGFPMDLTKAYTGPVKPHEYVVARFFVEHAIPHVYFDWLEGKARLPDPVLAAQLEAAPGHARVRDAWACEDGSFGDETCGGIGLEGAPPGRKLLTHVAMALTRDLGVVFASDNVLIFRVPGKGRASLARVLAHLREIVRVLVGDGKLFAAELEDLELDKLSESLVGLYVAYLEDDWAKARRCWAIVPPQARKEILDGEVSLFTQEVVRDLRYKVAA